MAEYISLAAFNQIEPARKLTERLTQAGFESELYDESTAQKWQLFQVDPHAQFRVRVLDTQSQEALKQIKAWDAAGSEDSLPQAIHCPECSSTLVEYPQFSRRTLVGALPAIAASAGVIERDYYCESCQFTWPAETPKAAAEVDALNWPKSWSK